MKEQLLEAWRTANRVNLLFVEHIPAEGLDKTLSAKGGRTVFDQLIHLHRVRLQWLEVTNKEIFKHYGAEGKEIKDKAGMERAFTSSGKAVEELIVESWEKDGKLTGFKKGLMPFISYLIAHEAHHRGSILLTLKQSGVKLPEVLKWGIWDWNKI